MASKRSPVMQPATASVMPLALLAVMKPASAPVAFATTSPATSCRCAISTNSTAMDAIAATASGTMMEAPSTVIVPAALMIGRSPNSLRMSRSDKLIEGEEIFDFMS